MNQEQRPIYQIQVQGRLHEDWEEWFGGMAMAVKGGTTILCGPLPDQAALHGVLARVRDLGLSLIAVQRVGPDKAEETEW